MGQQDSVLYVGLSQNEKCVFMVMKEDVTQCNSALTPESPVKYKVEGLTRLSMGPTQNAL